MKYFLIVICMALFLTESVAAGLADKDFLYSGKEGRAEAARRLQEDMKQLNNLIPTIAPEEEQWISNELNRISSITDEKTRRKQELRLFTNRYFKQSRLKFYLNEIVTDLDCVISTKTVLLEEIKCWTETAKLLLNSNLLDEALRALIKDKIITRKELDSISIMIDIGGYSYMPHAYGEYIIANVTLPFLKLQLKKSTAKSPFSKP